MREKQELGDKEDVGVVHFRYGLSLSAEAECMHVP